ncbi:hypothetical protein VP01_2365g2 [Puccinia sorghi]|uniref:Uncharacterized protein n=1 Tax=Puccinia sorghi TaxID=27349 RepID=A0A0L6V7A9_9BASI|nr:hypothetical protein VP01_2365g2 [Puccinia sorghi]
MAFLFEEKKFRSSGASLSFQCPERMVLFETREKWCYAGRMERGIRRSGEWPLIYLVSIPVFLYCLNNVNSKSPLITQENPEIISQDKNCDFPWDICRETKRDYREDTKVKESSWKASTTMKYVIPRERVIVMYVNFINSQISTSISIVISDHWAQDRNAYCEASPSSTMDVVNSIMLHKTLLSCLLSREEQTRQFMPGEMLRRSIKHCIKRMRSQGIKLSSNSLFVTGHERRQARRPHTVVDWNEACRFSWKPNSSSILLSCLVTIFAYRRDVSPIQPGDHRACKIDLAGRRPWLRGLLARFFLLVLKTPEMSPPTVMQVLTCLEQLDHYLHNPFLTILLCKGLHIGCRLWGHHARAVLATLAAIPRVVATPNVRWPLVCKRYGLKCMGVPLALVTFWPRLVLNPGISLLFCLRNPKLCVFQLSAMKNTTCITNNTQNHGQPIPIGNGEGRDVESSFWNVAQVTECMREGYGGRVRVFLASAGHHLQRFCQSGKGMNEDTSAFLSHRDFLWPSKSISDTSHALLTSCSSS